MLIKSLEKMEKIVFSNPRLSWDGWDVLITHPNPAAWRYSDGVFYRNKWHTQKRYAVGPKGWDIPEMIVSRNGQR
jgi:hypothetical protein